MTPTQDYATFMQDQMKVAARLWAESSPSSPSLSVTPPPSTSTPAAESTTTGFSWFDVITSIFYSWIGVILIIAVICYMIYVMIEMRERVQHLENKTRKLDSDYLRHLIQNNNVVFSKYHDQALKMTSAQLEKVDRPEFAEVLHMYNKQLQDLIADGQVALLSDVDASGMSS